MALKLYFAEKLRLLKLSICDTVIPMHGVGFCDAHILQCDHMMHNCHFFCWLKFHSQFTWWNLCVFYVYFLKFGYLSKWIHHFISTILSTLKLLVPLSEQVLSNSMKVSPLTSTPCALSSVPSSQAGSVLCP